MDSTMFATAAAVEVLAAAAEAFWQQGAGP
jgi:hypothetical protein